MSKKEVNGSRIIPNALRTRTFVTSGNASTAEELQSQIHVLRTAIEDINKKVALNKKETFKPVLQSTTQKRVVSNSPSKPIQSSSDDWGMNDSDNDIPILQGFDDNQTFSGF